MKEAEKLVSTGNSEISYPDQVSLLRSESKKYKQESKFYQNFTVGLAIVLCLILSAFSSDLLVKFIKNSQNESTTEFSSSDHLTSHKNLVVAFDCGTTGSRAYVYQYEQDIYLSDTIFSKNLKKLQLYKNPITQEPVHVDIDQFDNFQYLQDGTQNLNETETFWQIRLMLQEVARQLGGLKVDQPIKVMVLSTGGMRQMSETEQMFKIKNLWANLDELVRGLGFRRSKFFTRPVFGVWEAYFDFSVFG